MKVGDILKKETKGIPGLQYPYKIIINDNYKYPFLHKLENFIFLEKCNTFINEFPSNKLLNKPRSLSQKKVLMKNMSSYKFYLKTNSDNLEKAPINHLLNDNLPLLTGSTPKSNIKISHDLFNDCMLIKNRIKKFKNEEKNIKNKRDKEINSYFLKKDDKYINSNLRNNKINKTQKIKKRFKLKKFENIYEYRIYKKIKNMNIIIDKLNSPIFKYNNNETN